MRRRLCIIIAMIMIAATVMVPMDAVAYADDVNTSVVNDLEGDSSDGEGTTTPAGPTSDQTEDSNTDSGQGGTDADNSQTETDQPQTPDLGEPVLKSELTSTGFKLNWSLVSGAVSYKVYKKTGTGSWKLLKTCGESTSSCTDTSVTHGYAYTYRIVAVDSTGEQEATSNDSDTIYYIKGTSLSSVANKLNGSYYIKYKKATKSVSGYEVEISTDEEFANGSIKYSKTSTRLYNTLSGEGVSKYGHYYFHVRTYKTISGERHYSVWSSVYQTNLLDVPHVAQKSIGLPAGCEPVAAVQCMKYVAGSDIVGYTEFCDKYLPKGKTGPATNPNKAFMGNPRSRSAWGCYEPVILAATKHMNNAKGTDVKATAVHDSVATLCTKYINNDYPVTIWATVGMKRISVKRTLYFSGVRVYWYSPNHALTLVGYDSAGHYFFSDPLVSSKIKSYSKSTVQSRYKTKGSRAVVFK